MSARTTLFPLTDPSNSNDFKRTDNPTLKMVAAKVLERCPGPLVSVCVRLARNAEAAASCNRALDLHLFAAAQVAEALISLK